MGTKRKQKLNRFFFLAVPLAIFLLITLAPFYWILVTALKTSTEVFAKPLTYWPVNITFDNFVNLFKKLHFEQYFINSFIVSISVTTQRHGTDWRICHVQVQIQGKVICIRASSMYPDVSGSGADDPSVSEHEQSEADQ